MNDNLLSRNIRVDMPLVPPPQPPLPSPPSLPPERISRNPSVGQVWIFSGITNFRSKHNEHIDVGGGKANKKVNQISELLLKDTRTVDFIG